MRLTDQHFINVNGAVVMRYSHLIPDKMRFTMLREEFGVQGGMSLLLEPTEDDAPFEEGY